MIWKDPKCKITQSVWIQITSDNPNAIRLRKTHNVIQPWCSYSLKSAKNPIPEIKLDDLTEVYDEPLPIKKEKLANLLNICDYIPLKYVNFYENLKSE